MSYDALMEKYEYKGYEIEIHYDEDPINPLTEWDMAGVFIVTGNDRDYGHLSTGKLYDFGIHKHLYSSGYFRETDAGNEYDIDEEDIPAYIEKMGGIAITFDLSGNMQREWCEAMLVMDRDTIRKEYTQYRNGKIVSKGDRQKARELLKAQAQNIREWFAGEVFGYIVNDPYGESVDSCWGYYGYHDGIKMLKEDAESAVDDDIESKEKEVAEALDTFAFLEGEVA